MKNIKACANIIPNVALSTSEIVNHAVYNDWKLAIKSLLQFRSYTTYRLVIPYKFLFQLVKLASKIGSQQIVKMLHTTFKQCLLHQALARNVEEQETVEILLKNGADVNSWSKDGYLPIYIAAELDSLKNMQLLIKFGANVDARRKNGWSAIHYAVYKKRTHIVRFLIEKGSDVNASTDPENYQTPIHIATKVGSLDIVALLVQNGASLEGGMPVHVAAHLGYVDFVKLMTKYGANINARGPGAWTTIHYAASQTFMDMAKYLLQNGAEVNPKTNNGTMPIHLAAQSGCVSIMELLIKHGADVLAKGNSGNMPLHHAAYSKNIKPPQLLIDNGGNTHSANEGGYTPIDLAISYGSESIFRLFLKNGALVSQDSIHMAIENHSTEMIISLIEHGLDVNEIIGPFGKPAFYEAVKCGCIHCVKALKVCIEFGANTSMKDDEGKTSLEYALSKVRLGVFKFLSQNHNLK